MIPNYITSMSNCITSAPYYSICCLNECDQVFRQLEARIAAPSAPTSSIIEALETSPYAPSSISEVQRERLGQIASQQDNGQVPIYGRLFARWLHFVYPQECPFPHAAGVVKPLTQHQWKELVGADAESATDDEIAQHVESEFARRASSPDAGTLMWNLEESLLDSSTPSDLVASPVWALIRIVTQIGMIIGFISLLKPLFKLFRGDAKT